MKKNILSILFLVVLLGIQTDVASQKAPPPAFPQQDAPSWATEIDEEAKLYRVDSLFYRSMQLDEKHLYRLKNEGIDALLNLRFFNRNEDKKHFGEAGIELVNIPLKAWYIKPSHLAKALWEIEKRTKKGKTVLVHCKHGADRTGIVVAMYRVVYQEWTPEQAKDEMMNGPYEFHAVFGNLPKLLTDKTATAVKEVLRKLRIENERECANLLMGKRNSFTF
ncbi:MAG: dual specificity protein phosphatase family protein [Dysgonamonadaceae bacterium]|nr:dual specificity protein phosphatase family protein [Dysgonamonadaceae bacterium]